MKHYNFRKHKAWEIDLNISGLVDSTLIVGEVAYNPSAVAIDSDLEMVAVCDFQNTDFYDLHDALGVKPDPDSLRAASSLMANTYSIIFQSSRFSVGLYLWDRSALENAAMIKKGPNRVFAPYVVDDSLLSLVDTQHLWGLSGRKLSLPLELARVPKGHVIKFYPYFEDGKDLYIGNIPSQLLLNPVLLNDTGSVFMDAVAGFEERLQQKIVNVYSSQENSGRDIKLSNAFPFMIRNSLPESLKVYLDGIF